MYYFQNDTSPCFNQWLKKFLVPWLNCLDESDILVFVDENPFTAHTAVFSMASYSLLVVAKVSEERNAQ